MRYFASAFIYLCLAASARAENAPLLLAVHPYLPVAEIKARFTPLAHYLARETGRSVTVRVGRTYAEHIDAIGANAVDIAYMGPVPYVKLIATYGKKPLLARQEVAHQPYWRGVIFVRQDSPIHELAELKGKRFAFGDPDSTISRIISLRMLESAGVPQTALGHFEFLVGNKNVALAVLAGDYDSGAVNQEVFDEMSPKGLRALAISPPLADYVFVASSKMQPALQTRLRQALLHLKDTAEGKAIMAAIHPGMTALTPAKDADYDGVRTLMGLQHALSTKKHAAGT